MAKVHLQANKGLNGTPIYAACASRSTNSGVKRNSRSTYRDMTNKMVPYREFKNVPEEDRCQHCMVRGLQIKNRQRAKKGLLPVSHLFMD